MVAVLFCPITISIVEALRTDKITRSGFDVFYQILAPREFSSAMPNALCFFRKNREIALPERVRAGILFGKGEVLRRNDRDWHQQRRPVKNVEAPEFMVLV